MNGLYLALPGEAPGSELPQAETWDALSALLSGSASGSIGLVTGSGRIGTWYDPGDGDGVLVPPSLFDRLTGRVTGASGVAKVLLGDELADLTARGWTSGDTSGTGSVSKTADDPLVIDSGAGAGVGSLAFPLTGVEGSVALVCKLSAKTGSDPGGGNSYLYLGTDLLRWGWTNGAAALSFQNGVSPDANAKGAVALSMPAHLILIVDRSGSEALVRLFDPERDEEIIMESADLVSDGSIGPLYLGYCQFTGGAAHSASWDFAHILTMV